PPFEAPIEVRITGPDLEILRRLGEDVRRVLIETDGVTYTAAKLSGGEPKLVLATDEAEARLADLELVGIARQLDARLEGTVGGSALEGNEELPVRVRVDRGDRQDLPSLTAGRLLAASRSRPSDSTRIGGVPIQAIAKIELVPELAGIARRNGERINTVQGFLEPYKMIAGALADFEQRLEEAHIELPAGYAIGFGGENEQRSEAMGKLAAFALPLFVLMAGGIVLSFGSF
ncbi:MAG: efflux RND transporter permease subunit, partial [bacterium]|nr:efflux RND transporter permease subunit [bacterium]